MRRPVLLFLSLWLLAGTLPTAGASGRVIKVLPQLVDLKGRNSLSPSLYDRDAYQAWLRQHPDEVLGVRFNIQWKADRHYFAPLKLRAELRGTVEGKAPSRRVLEKTVMPGGWFSRWAALSLTGEDYKGFGEVIAWRVTLWEGDRLLSEQQSFLW